MLQNWKGSSCAWWLPLSITWSVFYGEILWKTNQGGGFKWREFSCANQIVSWLQDWLNCGIIIKRRYGVCTPGELHKQNINSEWFWIHLPEVGGKFQQPLAGPFWVCILTIRFHSIGIVWKYSSVLNYIFLGFL